MALALLTAIAVSLSGPALGQDPARRDEAAALRARALDPALAGAEAAKALRDGSDHLLHQDRLDELEPLINEVVLAHPEDVRVLTEAANQFLRIPHMGSTQNGTWRRGYKGGVPLLSLRDRDWVRSLQLHEQARLAGARQADPDAYAEALLAYAATLAMPMRWGPDGVAALTNRTDFTVLPSPDNDRRWRIENDPPVIFNLPPSFEEAANDGERIRWLHEEAARVSPLKQWNARLARAEFLLEAYGTDYRDRGTQPPTLPDEHNPVALLRRVADGSTLEPGEKALDKLAIHYEERGQFPQAVACLRESLERYGPGRDGSKQEKLRQLTGNWGWIVPSHSSSGTTRKTTIGYRFRNGTRVTFVARPVDLPEQIRSGRDRIMERLAMTRPHTPLGIDLLPVLDSPGAGAVAAEWSIDLQPLPDHRDRVIDVGIPSRKGGLYRITASMENGNTTIGFAWIQDTLLVCRPVAGGFLIYAADAESGAPVPGARIEGFGYRREINAVVEGGVRPAVPLADGITGMTDASGMAEWEAPAGADRWLFMASTADGRFTYLPWESPSTPDPAPPLSGTNVYLMTDRPSYRPGQTVFINAWISPVDLHAPIPKSPFAHKKFHLDVCDPEGNTLLHSIPQADAFGMITGRVDLPGESPSSPHRIDIWTMEPFNGDYRHTEWSPRNWFAVTAPEPPAADGNPLPQVPEGIPTATVQQVSFAGQPVLLRLAAMPSNRTVLVFRKTADGTCRRPDVLVTTGEPIVHAVATEAGDAPALTVETCVIGGGLVRSGTTVIPVLPAHHYLDVAVEPLRTWAVPFETNRITVRVRSADGQPAPCALVVSVQDQNRETRPDGLTDRPVHQRFDRSQNLSHPGLSGVPPELEGDPVWITTATDSNGVAGLEFPMPENLGDWTVRVRAFGQVGDAGEARVTVTNAHPVRVLLRSPRNGVEGDEFQAAAQVFNRSETDVELEVELDADSAALELLEAAAHARVAVPAGGDTNVNWRLKALRPMTSPIRVRVTSPAGHDTTARSIRIVPADAVPDPDKPSDPSTIGLLETVSAGLPGASDAIARLAETQSEDGSWNWFPRRQGDTSAHVTALVVRTLIKARAAGLPVPVESSERGREWLIRYANDHVMYLRNSPGNGKWKEHADNTDALVTLALVEADRNPTGMAHFLVRDRSRLTAYGLSLLGLALERLHRTNDLATVLADLGAKIERDDVHQASWFKVEESRPWWLWYGDRFEAQAAYLTLLGRTDPRGEQAMAIARGLRIANPAPTNFPGIQVTRRLVRLEPAVDRADDKFPSRVPVTDDAVLKRGDRVEIDIELIAQRNCDYLVVEEWTTGGLQPVETRSGHVGRDGAVYRQAGGDTVRFFVRTLSRGTNTITYRVRADLPGRYQSPPVRVRGLYAPEVQAFSSPLRMGIDE